MRRRLIQILMLILIFKAARAHCCKLQTAKLLHNPHIFDRPIFQNSIPNVRYVMLCYVMFCNASLEYHVERIT